MNKEYYFAYYSSDSTIEKYFYIDMSKSNDTVYHKKHILNSDKEIESVENESYLMKKDTLYKEITIEGINTYVAILTVKDTACIFASYGNEQLEFLDSQYCFIGLQDITINKQMYRNAYHFEKIIGAVDFVKTNIYLDSLFIPIYEEYVEGYRDYFYIIRIDNF